MHRITIRSGPCGNKMGSSRTRGWYNVWLRLGNAFWCEFWKKNYGYAYEPKSSFDPDLILVFFVIFLLCPQSAFYPRSAVCSLQSAVCSLQSAVCSLRSAVCSLQMSYTVARATVHGTTTEMLAINSRMTITPRKPRHLWATEKKKEIPRKRKWVLRPKREDVQKVKVWERPRQTTKVSSWLGQRG